MEAVPKLKLVELSHITLACNIHKYPYRATDEEHLSLIGAAGEFIALLGKSGMSYNTFLFTQGDIQTAALLAEKLLEESITREHELTEIKQNYENSRSWRLTSILRQIKRCLTRVGK